MDWLFAFFSSPFVWLGIGALVLLFLIEGWENSKNKEKKEEALEARIKELEKKLENKKEQQQIS